MPDFEWRQRPTRHFGESWVPLAEVELSTSDSGPFHVIAMTVDSGAVASLLRRSTADLLGIRLEDGRKIDLTGIGGGGTVAWVHELHAKFGNSLRVRAPFAIADREDVPNLLGRKGVFDQLQVDFDSSLRETRLTAPWLNESRRKVFEFLLETERHVLDRWKSSPLREPLDQVAGQLFRQSSQVFAAICGLAKLHYGGGAVLARSHLELVLQLEYVLKDPQRRAQQFLDFAHVSRYKQTNKIAQGPRGPELDKVFRSENRETTRRRVEAEFQRVETTFRKDPLKPNKHWDNWYCMTVRDLARTLNREPEYLFMYSWCSKWTHGDPVTLPRAQPGPPGMWYMLCRCYHQRALLLLADALGVVLTAKQDRFLRKYSGGVS